MGITTADVAFLVLVYLLLVALSFVFSAAETSYSSLRVTLVRLWAANGDKRAQKVIKLVNNLPHTLNAIVIGDNLVNIVFTSIATYSGFAYGGTLGAVLLSVVNLAVVFVISEAWPKTLAANNPEDLALRLSGFMNTYIVVMDLPATLFSTMGQKLSQVFPWAKPRKHIGTEERVLYTLELAKAEGVITHRQHLIISRLLKMDEVAAKELMIPLEKAVFLRSGTTIEDAMRVFSESGHRRLPVLRADDVGNMLPSGSVVGALFIRDATVLYLNGYGNTVVDQVCEPVVAALEDTKLIEVLNRMHEKGAQVASVEDGSYVKGFIFMNDLLESIFGEAASQKQSHSLLDRLKRRAGGSKGYDSKQ